MPIFLVVVGLPKWANVLKAQIPSFSQHHLDFSNLWKGLISKSSFKSLSSLRKQSQLKAAVELVFHSCQPLE